MSEIHAKYFYELVQMTFESSANRWLSSAFETAAYHYLCTKEITEDQAPKIKFCFLKLFVRNFILSFNSNKVAGFSTQITNRNG